VVRTDDVLASLEISGSPRRRSRRYPAYPSAPIAAAASGGPHAFSGPEVRKPITAPNDRDDRSDQRAWRLSTDPMLIDDPIEPQDANEPIDPTDANDPTLRIDKADPDDPMDRTEFVDHNDHREPSVIQSC
jgi:hypothetical protein